MNNFTKKQRVEILHHVRAATLHRSKQWDHERAIELILGHDIELGVEEFAFGVEPEHETPEELTFLKEEHFAYIYSQE